eukprot:CAMPEP_0194272508 /NCGR_PEP_ID=MMETSP0169-20130528/6068_1 /TAXON_ID=218684 /ORGANISM="Corethron pennatum, Strain L29A3" /LENGTH=504 /DNA_ID=CAMNT_0039015199 /DNA_START=26 /DNA_END=1540 /DNA_ORIENTATION=+
MPGNRGVVLTSYSQKLRSPRRNQKRPFQENRALVFFLFFIVFFFAYQINNYSIISNFSSSPNPNDEDEERTTTFFASNTIFGKIFNRRNRLCRRFHGLLPGAAPVDHNGDDDGGMCAYYTKSDLVDRCLEILARHNPGNRACKYAVEYLQSEEANSLSEEDFGTFVRIVRSGIENPDSSLGCYATAPNDYTKFRGFFDRVIRDYHGDTTGSKKHVTDWNTSGDGDYYNGRDRFDLRKLGMGDDVSMRVRVARNLAGFNLPGGMTKEDRVKFERTLLHAFDSLSAEYGGNVYSLTPDFDGSANPNLISEGFYGDLVDAHVMFKDMSVDPYLQSAGISNDWPYGRGCWQSGDKTRIVWFGEEDQLRIMSLQKGSNILDVFSALEETLTAMEQIDGIAFAVDETYGYITSCPSNLGTAMRASVHVRVPALTFDGTDAKVKEICTPLGLSVRGVGGEHTPIGSDGTVDVSPSARLFVKENEIIESLYAGVESLLLAENKLAGQTVPKT